MMTFSYHRPFCFSGPHSEQPLVIPYIWSEFKVLVKMYYKFYMRKQLLSICFIAIAAFCTGQTATDFTADDCNGISHNLFTDLDAGKVIVICWVMPCGTCTGPALTSYNIVESYAMSHPGKVSMFLCDDYANTPCSSLDTWANAYGLKNAIRFSNPNILMTDYGPSAMPKVVVVGGANHTVFYNANNAVNATDFQNAVNSALSTTAINDPDRNIFSLNLFPNPASHTAEINFTLKQPSDIHIDLFNLEGQLVKMVYTGQQPAGEVKIQMDVAGYPAGMYLVKLSDGNQTTFVNLIVSQ
jgi:hypothetical protein